MTSMTLICPSKPMSYDITGQRFGHLTVIERVESDPNRKEWRWKCLCDCGNYTVVPSYRLRTGGVKSCGCHAHDRDFCSKKAKNHPRLYRVYKDMIRRCTYSKDDSYHLYGARGISVCDEWSKFDAFCDWALKNGYDENAPLGECTIDRIDGNKNYSPDNCRWVSMRVQNNNRRDNNKITFNGETKTITEWEREYGLCHGTITKRLKRGWSLEHAITIPRMRGSGHYYRKTYGETNQG